MRSAIVVVLLIIGALWIVDPFGGDDLPETSDSEWVAEQRAALTTKRVTTGRFLSTEHDEVQEVTSGWEPISERIAEVLRQSPIFPDLPPSAKPNVAGDVETKTAMMMREAEATTGVVVINHPQMCDGAMSCRTAVPALLPEGSTLYVWELDAKEPLVIAGKAET